MSAAREPHPLTSWTPDPEWHTFTRKWHEMFVLARDLEMLAAELHSEHGAALRAMEELVEEGQIHPTNSGVLALRHEYDRSGELLYSSLMPARKQIESGAYATYEKYETRKDNAKNTTEA